MQQHQPIQPEVASEMKEVGRLIGGALPDGWGFALLTFPLNNPEGRMNYISNAKREDMLIALKEFIANCEGRVLITPKSKQ